MSDKKERNETEAPAEKASGKRGPSRKTEAKIGEEAGTAGTRGKTAGKTGGARKKKAGAAEKVAEEKKVAEDIPGPTAEDIEGHREEGVSSEAKAGKKAEAAQEEGELSEEELRRLVEEQMEKITVRDVVFQMMASLASLAYQKLGLPENVNLKYRDFSQARMAIDALKGLLTSLEGKEEEGRLSPFRGTLANLQMNYVRLMKPGG